MSGNSRIGFCALEYRQQDEYQLFHDETRVIVIISTTPDGRLIMRVNPRWRSIVDSSQCEYLQELLDEFKQRAQVAPEDLMDQLSTVNVGPVVTRDTGQRLEDSPALFRLFEDFQAA